MKALAVLFALSATPIAAQTVPDIAIRARVQANRVEVKQQGEAKLEVRADPGVAEPVRVQRSAPAGRTSYRNLTITLDAEARITGPSAVSNPATEPAPTGEPE